MVSLLAEDITKSNGKFTDLSVQSGMLNLIAKKIGDPKHPHFLKFEIVFTFIQAKSYPYVDVVKPNRKKFRGR